LLLLTLCSAASAEDGEQLFAPCRACHSLDPAEHSMPGPNLAKLNGRPVGGDEAFDYSPALRKAHGESLRWDTQRLEAFLADPAAMFPGLWMSMRGIEDANDRQALVRFLSVPSSR
jgi:cytochrome c